MAAPIAPHSNMKFDVSASEHSIIASPPVSAKRHEHLFKDVVVPRNPNFDPDESHGVFWVSRLPKQSQPNIDSNDHFYRQRLRALQVVDELVEGIVLRLEDAGVLDNTYIFFSSDNGYYIGQHRLQPGKECGFEEDTNVPLIVRGPGVSEGCVSDFVTSHTDLAPIFLTLASGEQSDDFDGAAIPLTLDRQQASGTRDEHVNIEYWGYALVEGDLEEGTTGTTPTKHCD